jgi:hypothetical protein
MGLASGAKIFRRFAALEPNPGAREFIIELLLQDTGCQVVGPVPKHRPPTNTCT